MTSVRITVLLVLVIVLLASSYNVPAKYPGLTVAQARCPEEPSDPDWWFLTEIDKVPLCFGRYPLPTKINSALDLATACHEKHENAEPMQVAGDKYYCWFKYFKIFGLFGVSGDFSNLHESGISKITLPIEGSSYYVVCVTQAYPRVLSTFNHPIEPTPDLSLYKCEGDGWNMQAFCGGTPFCYKSVLLYSYTEFDEFNRCGMLAPNSFPVSLHCEAESKYALSRNGLVQFGYKLPQLSLWNRFDSWHNVDGTPADYAPWYCTEPNNWNGKSETIATSYNHVLIDHPQYEFQNQYFNTLCKKPAVKKTVPLDVKVYKTFKHHGKTCRKEAPSHWNRRCPAGRDSWRIVESEAGVHCYDFVPLPTPLTKNNFKNNICKQLHPHAKLASFHNDVQVGLIYNLADINKVIVGLFYEYDAFHWADGTPVNKSFLARNAPQPSADTIAHFKIHKVPTPCPTCSGYTYDRPLLVTKPISEVPSDMVIACKVEAEPLLGCTPLPDVNPFASLDNTECDPGWSKQRLCGNVYCYIEADPSPSDQNFENIVSRDWCEATYPSKGAHLASVHCIEEHYYIQSLRAQSIIGLHIPKNLQNNGTFNIGDFRWTDGSPVDFVGWNRFSKHRTSAENKQEPLFKDSRVYVYNLPGYVAYNHRGDGSSGWTNVDYGFTRAICKRKATIKQ